MLAFAGTFTTNALLPEGIGLGEAVSRGFGTIQPVHTSSPSATLTTGLTWFSTTAPSSVTCW
jgi:hypothetical protein